MLFRSPRYARAADRSKNRDALNAEIAELTRTRSSAEWVELLNEAGVPTGPIYSIDQVFADPQVQHLKMAAAVDSPVRGRMELVAQPIVLSRTPSSLAAPPPEAGQHTDEVLAEAGYTPAEIADFRARQIV